MHYSQSDKGPDALTVMVLAFVIYFIVKEALPTFDEVAVPDFLLGQRWMPIAYTGEPSFGIFNFIAATLYVSLVAMVLAVTVGWEPPFIFPALPRNGCGESFIPLWTFWPVFHR